MDGLTGATYEHQWIRVDGTDETEITGATDSTYKLAAADLDKKIMVRVTFYDDDGDRETLTSAAYPTSGTVSANTAPTGSDKTVTTNEDTAHAFSVTDFNFSDTDTGDALASVKIVTPPASGKGALALDGTAVTAGEAVTKAEIEENKLVYTPPEHENGAGYASFTFKVSDGGLESTSAYTMTIDVTAVDDAATGAPAITGPPRVGVTLTASKGTIADADGLTRADNGETGYAYTYRWVRVDADGSSNATDIAGATSSTYKLTSAEVDKKIKVTVSFADDTGNDESRTSDAYPSAQTIVADTTAPLVGMPTVDGDSLVLTYNEDLDEGSTPDGSSFTVTAAGSTHTVSGVTVSGRTVTLTLSSAVESGQTVTVTYQVPATDAIQDLSENRAAALTSQGVTNDTAPVFESATVDGASLVVTFDQPLHQDRTPPAGAFAVTVAGAPRNVIDVSVTGREVTVTLASAAVFGEAVTVSYTPPAIDPLQDSSGNEVVAFSDETASNSTNVAPVFAGGAVRRSVVENSAADVAVGAEVTATDANKDTLTYALEGTDAASFAIDASTGQIETIAGVDYDYEMKTSYSVTVRVEDGRGGSDTVDVTIGVVNLPAVSIAAVQPRVLMSDGQVNFTVTSDATPSGDLDIPVVPVQDRTWFDLTPASLPSAEYRLMSGEWRLPAYTFKADAPARGGDFTVTLQPGAGYELGTKTATVAIVAADTLITVRAEEASYTVTEDGGTVTVTLRAETIAGAPKPRMSPTISWAAVAGTATGAGADFGDAGGDVAFLESEFTEQGGRWVLTKDIEVTLVDDSTWEPTERFHIALSRHSTLHRLVKLANADETLCENNLTGVNCGATVTVTDNDNVAPVFAGASTTREVAENSLAGTAVGAPVTATDANTGDGDELTYTLEGTDAASFAIAASTGQIETIAGVDYDYEGSKPSHSVTVTATDREGASDTVDVTIGVVNLPAVSIAAVQPRVLMSDGQVNFTVTSDATPSGDLDIPVVPVQDRTWFDLTPASLPSAEYRLMSGEWRLPAYTFKADAPARGGDFTVTLQPGAGYELGTKTATVAIVAADTLITVRAEEASYTVTEDGDTVTVTLRAETIAGAPKPRMSPTISWAAVAGTADFGDAGGDVAFLESEFTEQGGRWVLTKDIEVTLVDDSTWEPTERFHIALSRHSTLHRLVKLANADETLCENNLPGVNCGATVTVTDNDNVAPVFAGASTTREVAENSLAGTAAGAPVTATDANTGDGDELTYTLEGTDAASFAIAASTGQIETIAGVDYDYEGSKPSYSVTVTATDREGASDTVDVTIDLTDVPNEVILATLDGLALSRIELDQSFASDLMDYTATVPYAVGRTTVTADLTSDGATAAIVPVDAASEPGHQVDLDVGDTTITVRVTSPDRDDETYRVTVTRELPRPEAPVAFGGTGEEGTVTLEWQAPDDGGLPPVLSYEYRYRSVGGTWPSSWTTVPGGASARGLEVTNLEATGRYEFELRAVNVNGPGPVSSAVVVGSASYGTVTASFGDHPDPPVHFGAAFRVTLNFSQLVRGERPEMIGHGVRVSGGTARHVEPHFHRPRQIHLEVTPSGTGDVEVTLEPLPCDVAGSICTSGGSGLLGRQKLSVRGVGSVPDRPANVQGLRTDDGYVVLFWDLNEDATAYTLRWRPRGGEWREESGRPPGPGVQIHRYGPTRLAPAELPAEAFGPLERGRSYDVELRWENPRGSGSWVNVSDAVRNLTPPRPRSLTLTQRGPSAVALDWRPGAVAGTMSIAKHQVRLARHPQYLPGGVDLHYPTIRVFRDDGWVDIPDSGHNEANFGSALLSGAFRGQPLLHVWELRAQVRAVSAAGTVGEASEVAFVPDTAPGFAGFELLSRPANGTSWSAGDIIAVALAVSEPVTVTGGTPTLALRIGGENREAAFTRLYHPDWAYEGGWVGRSGTRMRFEYTVTADDATDDAEGGIEIPGGEVRLNGATVLDGTLLLGAGVGRKSAVLSWASTTALGNSVGAAHTLSVADAAATEDAGASLAFVVTLAPAAAETVTVDYATADGTATQDDDYTATNGTLRFAPGETTKTVAVPIVDDSEEDDWETLTLTLSNAVGAELIDAEATGTIRNMEDAVDPAHSLSIADAAAAEGGSLAFTVTLAPAAGDEVTVDWATADGPSPDGAIAGSDYTAGSGTLIFAAGETSKTVTVAVLDDSADEISETLTLTLSNASGAGIGDGDATGTLADNDGPAPLTATFANVPAAHDGSGAISLRIGLDAALSSSWKGVRHSLAIANGALTRIHRIDGRSDLWGIDVAPAGDGDVTVRLNPSADCADPATTMCSSGGRRIETAVSAVIPGPATVDTPAPVDTTAPLTARFVNMPSGHDSGSFTFRILFSEPISTGWKTMRDSSVRVTQDGRTGGAAGARRVDGRKDLWEIDVDPASGADIEIGLGPTAACTDTGAVCTGGGKALSGGLQASVVGPPGLSVADARVREAADATVDFAVTLSRAAGATVTVDYATSDGTATAGSDYTAATGTLTFAPGETAKTVSVAVTADDHDEDEETFTLTLSNASGNNAWLSDATATGTIENTGAMPRAWLARFARTVAEQVIEAVGARLRAAPRSGVEATLAGEALPRRNADGTDAGGTTDSGTEDAAAREAEAQERLTALSDWLGGRQDGEDGADRAGYGSRAVTERDLLTGTSFALTAETAGGAGGLVSLWGRGAVSRFDGREGELSLDGEVASAMLGTDWTLEAWTAGLLLSHSRGEGGYRGAGEGIVSSTVTGLYPYGRFMVNPRVTLWGVAGYGSGTLTLTPKTAEADGKDSPIRTDMALTMAAAGVRGVAVEAPAEGGFELAVTSDAMMARSSSEKTAGLAAAEAEVTRLRLGLEGSWRGIAFGGGELTPRLEAGMRHDGGDAETGFGLDLGGGLAWAHPASGISADLSGRGLLTHEAGGFRERGLSGSFAWDPGQGSGRGPKLTLTQTLGASASGGMNALLGRETPAGLAANDNGEDELQQRRLELRLAYGFPAFGGRFTSTPELGLGLSNGRREYSLGWRLNRVQGPAALELRLEATRREETNDNEDPVHGIGFRLTGRF